MNDKEKDLYLNKSVKTTTAKSVDIGIEKDATLVNNIMNMAQSGQVDMSQIQAFTRLADDRNRTYELIDAMAEDSTMGAVLETYAEYATEYNEKGKIVWAESDDPNILSYINYLMSTLRIDNNIYKWVYRLCKDGDLYLRLFRESQVSDDFDYKQKSSLNENVS